VCCSKRPRREFVTFRCESCDTSLDCVLCSSVSQCVAVCCSKRSTGEFVNFRCDSSVVTLTLIVRCCSVSQCVAARDRRESS